MEYKNNGKNIYKNIRKGKSNESVMQEAQK